MSAIGSGEPFVDANANGKWDTGENYTDSNSNGKYDSDIGATGYGGSGDVIDGGEGSDIAIYTQGIEGVTALFEGSTVFLTVPGA